MIATALLAAAAVAAPGVSLAATVPEPGIISAKASGSLLYVSATTGVSVYDIANPRAPARIGRLELPNAQNEDVDVGGGILLVSDDPAGGRGLLHVVDVRDPREPRLLSTLSTWSPEGGIGHTATCLQRCRWAWLAGSAAGVDVVDLRDPANPRIAGRVPVRAAAGLGTHDVQVDARGLAWVAGGNGTAAYDVRDPLRPRLVARTDRRGETGPWNDFIHHNSQRLPGGVVAITEEDLRPGCAGAGTFQTWRIGRGGRLRPLARFGVERDRRARVLCSAHYFEHRDGLVAAGFYEQGLRLLDVRDPRRIRQVGFLERPRAMTWGALWAPTDPAGATVYALDHARGIDVIAVDRTRLRPVRRPAVRRAPGAGAPDVFGYVDDGLTEARPGRAVTITVAAGAGSGGRLAGVELEVRLGAAYVDVQPPRGAAYDPATRTLRVAVGRLRGVAQRRFRARIDPAARPGDVLELIAYARARGDVLPLDDRGVDRGLVGARTVRSDRVRAAAAASAPRLFCALPRG